MQTCQCCLSCDCSLSVAPQPLAAAAASLTCLPAELGAAAASLGGTSSTADLEAALGMPAQGKSVKLAPTAQGRAANLRLVLAANLAAVRWGLLDESMADESALLPLLGSAQVHDAYHAQGCCGIGSA